MKRKIFALTVGILLIFSGVLAVVGDKAMDTDDEGLEPAVGQEPDPAYFAVNIDSTNSPVTEGETLDVTATINNTGGVTDTQSIELMADGVLRDQTTVTVDAGVEKEVTLSWDTGEGDAANYMVAVTSVNETTSVGVRILEGSYFSVNIDSINSPVTEGDTLNVTATINNTGDMADTQEIELMIGGTIRDTKTFTLDPGADNVVTLSWGTVEGDGGDYTAEVASKDETDSQAITIIEASTFEVSIDSTTSPVTVGDALKVHATVSNTGRETGTQEIGLMIGNVTMDTIDGTINPGGDISVALRWDTGEGDEGTYDAQVYSADDSYTMSVQVVPERYTLNITVEGEGTLEVDGVEMTAPHEEMYDDGTSVDLEAVSADGWQFDGWSGDVSGDETNITVTMDENKTITLRFTEEEDGGDDGGLIPGFTSVLLLSAVVVAAAIWYERKR